MSARKPRPRRAISWRHVRLLKLLGFRYSFSRDAYVLRLVGGHRGPVYRVRDAELPAPGGMSTLAR